ncbi:transglutaminase family protein [Paucibacter sp. O1-1]|nr:transglutaminase family protein [Paucibacter sp. O1-1]MDA3827894.1 transglutaminase family protein [Paucibacter sp. O1-1]
MLLQRQLKALSMPVVIEGYESCPADSRIEKYAETPDPGVIEVNIHPSNPWPQLVERTNQRMIRAS